MLHDAAFLLLANQMWFALHVLNSRASSRVLGVSIMCLNYTGEFKSGKKILAQRQHRSVIFRTYTEESVRCN